MKKGSYFTYTAIFLISSVTIAYYFMYRIMFSPGDETEHSIGITIVSLIWGIITFVVLSIFFVKNIRVKFTRYFFGGLILMLPATWFCLQIVFFQIFYLEITALHPVWGVDGRMPDLSTDGIIFIIVAVSMFVLGFRFKVYFVVEEYGVTTCYG